MIVVGGVCIVITVPATTPPPARRNREARGCKLQNFLLLKQNGWVLIVLEALLHYHRNVDRDDRIGPRSADLFTPMLTLLLLRILKIKEKQ